MKCGLIFGCFDLFHIGHLNILKRCKEYCDYLIVGVCNDQHIHDRKMRTPAFSEAERLAIVSSIKYVDEAHLIYGDLIDNVDFIKANHVDIIFAGSDHKDEPQFTQLTEEVMIFPHTTGISTTTIMQRLKLA
jgi:glycerol-3-phosphate cytidylyltransferase